ncbi:MAG: tetratricopeptide repeat protein, partial [Desulfobulbaceae bacterium]|nr:tetratricopeptide repeat protein [Desulfobulbaceae bacterium]
IGGYSPLHYLGFGVFGLIWYDIDPEQALKAADTLLHRLMHERFSRVHIGIAPGPKNEKEDGKSAGSVSGDGEMLLAEAWQALKTARRRGPYALCSYASLQDPAKHPLRNPSSHVMSVLKRQWSGKDHFALVLLRRDQKTEETGFSKRISSLIGPDHPVFFENNREAFVFLDDAAEQEALDWITRFKSRLKTPSGSALFREDVTFSAGIALYPCFDFKKSAMPAGARKALKHTEFFGPDTMTVFDGVSLNISGDIYYNEGDLARAVKEYRKGLVLDPENINLMNSLAVAYAQMNRYQKAIPLLERALLIDEADFMALLNLGFAYLATGQQGAAVESFERALAIDDNHFDLLLQLGKQYCLLERFEEARELLERCKGLLEGVKEEAGGQGETKTGLDGYGARPRDVDRGVVNRYLGMAYKGLGDSRQAMVCLQKAAKFNPWDVTALCILGELYALEKQGNDIAESLCRQAIALDDSRSSCWRALAHVQFLNRDFEAARESLKQALRLDRNNIEALLLAGRVYEKLGQDSRGVKMYERVLRLDAANRKALQAVKRLR